MAGRAQREDAGVAAALAELATLFPADQGMVCEQRGRLPAEVARVLRDVPDDACTRDRDEVP